MIAVFDMNLSKNCDNGGAGHVGHGSAIRHMARTQSRPDGHRNGHCAACATGARPIGLGTLILTGGMKSLRFGRLGQSGPRLRGVSLHDVLWWLLAIGIVIAAVRLLWMIVTPVSPLGDWRPASVRVMPDGVRSALMRGFDPFNRTPPQIMAEAGPVETITDLPLTVYGIRYNAATGAGTAIIADNDGEQNIFRIGEEVSPGVTLSALEFDHVVLSRGGARELLYLDQSQPAPSIQPSVRPSLRPEPAGGEAQSRMTASELRAGVSFAPSGQGGNFAGMAVSPAGDGSVFRAAGLRDGDIVVAMGGQRISSPAQAAQLSGAFTPGSQVSLTVRRDGREVPVNITVAP